MLTKSGIAIFVVALVAAPPALADTTLHYQVSRGGTTIPMVLKAQPGAVRVEGADVGVGFQWMVYRSADDTLYAVNPDNETFLALDAAAIELISRRMDALRAELRERLKDMPVGQRKFVESQIGDFLKDSRGEPPAVTIEMSGAEAEVSGVACREGRITVHGRTVGELCLAAAEALGLSPAELDAYQGLYGLINDLQAAMSSDAAMAPDLAALSGVPVRMRIDPGGITQRLEGVEHKPLPDEVFKIPEGYQRMEPQDLLQ